MQGTNIKQLLTKHIITILCIVAIIALALPMATVVSKSEIMGKAVNSKSTVSGFKALSSNFFAYFLLIGPIVLVAMNYIKQLEKYKGLLAVLVPIICLFALILVVIQAKSGTAAASTSMSKAKVSLNIGFGAVLAGLSYVATGIAGAVIYHNFKFDKASLKNFDLDKLKASGSELFSSAQQKVAQMRAGKNSEDGNPPAPATPAAVSATPAVTPKRTNINRTDEILGLIEKLAQMKDRGILTEEEFQKKKQELLEEI